MASIQGGPSLTGVGAVTTSYHYPVVSSAPTSSSSTSGTAEVNAVVLRCLQEARELIAGRLAQIEGALPNLNAQYDKLQCPANTIVILAVLILFGGFAGSVAGARSIPEDEDNRGLEGAAIIVGGTALSVIFCLMCCFAPPARKRRAILNRIYSFENEQKILKKCQAITSFLRDAYCFYEASQKEAGNRKASDFINFLQRYQNDIYAYAEMKAKERAEEDFKATERKYATSTAQESNNIV